MPKFYPDEVREKAVRLVVDHRGDYPSEWAAIKTVAERIGANPETVRNWVRKTQTSTGTPVAPHPVSEDVAAELKALRRKNRELEKTVEILKAATSFFARECDPPQR